MTWLLALLASLVAGVGNDRGRRMALNEARNRVGLREEPEPAPVRRELDLETTPAGLVLDAMARSPFPGTLFIEYVRFIEDFIEATGMDVSLNLDDEAVVAQALDALRERAGVFAIELARPVAEPVLDLIATAFGRRFADSFTEHVAWNTMVKPLDHSQVVALALAGRTHPELVDILYQACSTQEGWTIETSVPDLEPAPAGIALLKIVLGSLERMIAASHVGPGTLAEYEEIPMLLDLDTPGAVFVHEFGPGLPFEERATLPRHLAWRANDILDWMRGANPAGLDAMTWAEADLQAQGWHARFAQAREQIERVLQPYELGEEEYQLTRGDRPSRRGTPVAVFPDGAAIVRLTNRKDIEEEGHRMGHCVGGYWDEVAKGDCEIFSYRDPEGYPVATIDVMTTTSYTWRAVRQVKGVDNQTPVPDGTALGRITWFLVETGAYQGSAMRVDEILDIWGFVPSYAGWMARKWGKDAVELDILRMRNAGRWFAVERPGSSAQARTALDHALREMSHLSTVTGYTYSVQQRGLEWLLRAWHPKGDVVRVPNILALPGVPHAPYPYYWILVDVRDTKTHANVAVVAPRLVIIPAEGRRQERVRGEWWAWNLREPTSAESGAEGWMPINYLRTRSFADEPQSRRASAPSLEEALILSGALARDESEFDRLELAEDTRQDEVLSRLAQGGRLLYEPEVIHEKTPADFLKRAADEKIQ